MERVNDSDPAPFDADLFARCEGPLPSGLWSGRSNAIFCVGSCFHRRSAVRRLWIRAGGELTEVRNRSLPRHDLFLELHRSGAGADPEDRSYRSGFWAVVPVGPLQPGPIEITVLAELEDGSTASAPFAEIPIVPAPPPPGAGAGRPAGIGKSMATNEPDPERLAVQ